MTASSQPDATDALPKSWDPSAVESKLYQGWVDAGYFTADPASGKPPYSIVLPPPNVTGNLHVGHALDHTLMDILSRWHRMTGDEVLWLPGMDHAGTGLLPGAAHAARGGPAPITGTAGVAA